MRRLSGQTLNTLTRVLIRRRQGERGEEANTRPEMGRKSNRTCSPESWKELLEDGKRKEWMNAPLPRVPQEKPRTLILTS